MRKPFPIPKISTVLQELEGFTYATALDLNMGYYTIRLDPDASKICNIILPCDMSQGCSQGYKPKTGPKRTQNKYILKQRKYKYFTSLKL
jgi:hypothetical protein